MKVRVKDNTVYIEGYVNAVERKSKVLTDRFGNFVERIKAGAFGRALKRNPNIRILLNHNWDRDLGGTDSNLKLEEDNIGLRATATITDPEVVEDAKNGNLVGWSFGFSDMENGVDITEEEGLPVRNVKDLELYEVSLLNRKAIPAYDGTLVSVRADGSNLNISGYEEFTDIEIEEPAEEAKEEPAEEKQEEKTPAEVRAEDNDGNNDKDNEHAEKGAVDYTKYKEIIAEMKGEN